MYKVAFVDDFPDLFESVEEILIDYQDEGKFKEISLRPFETFYGMSRCSTTFDAVITDVSAICGIHNLQNGIRCIVNYLEDHPNTPIFIRTMLGYKEVSEIIDEVKSYFDGYVHIDYMSWEQDYLAFRQLEKVLKVNK